MWKEAGKTYETLFRNVEEAEGLPNDLLFRVAYQECRFRQDIILGKIVSSAGAVGIMQIVPRWHPGVDPLNVIAAVRYAGKYLKQLHDRFGSWPLALAAYNFGPGNVNKTSPEKWPEETKNYVAQILADVDL